MLRMLTVGPYQANCYILGCKKTKAGLVIDPGDEVLRIQKEISRLGLSIERILITHGHIDHISGAKELKMLTHAPLCIHPLDAPALNSPPDCPLSDGQEIPLGTFKINVIHTPGHSPGSVCFFTPGALFTGGAGATAGGAAGRAALLGVHAGAADALLARFACFAGIPALAAGRRIGAGLALSALAAAGAGGGVAGHAGLAGAYRAGRRVGRPHDFFGTLGWRDRDVDPEGGRR